jgi:hypothetical protein
MCCKNVFLVFIILCILGCGNNDNPVSTVNNSNPVIQSVTFSPDIIRAGESCIIHCEAFDEDNDKLSYQWETVGPTSGSGASIFFTPSACCGLPIIILTVDDGKGGSVDTMITVPFSYE